MVLIETEVYHAMSQTAKVYAKQQMVHFISEISEEQRQGDAGRISGSGNARGTFFLIYDGSSLCENMIEGGRRGIKISSSLASGQTVRLKAEYTLKMTIPFFSSIRFRKKAVVKRRIFSGYIKHQGETDDMGENPIVYVAENGVVYHKNASCSHICLKISGSKRIQDILHSSKYNACEKCIYKGVTPSVLFVTTYGDCYHSSLACSGLKRTIRAVRLNDVGGLRPCSRCAS